MSTQDANHKKTRELILDTAEHLFARNGIADTSVRDITSAANVNTAAVNYHFGGRDNLVREVFARRTGPVNAERLALLAGLSDAERSEVRAILTAFVQPVVDAIQAPDRADFVTLVGRAHGEPSPLLRSIMESEFREVFEAFIAALGDACPDLDRKDLVWRFQFALGSMIHMVCSQPISAMTEGSNCRSADPRETADRLIAFMTGGFEAASGYDAGGSE